MTGRGRLAGAVLTIGAVLGALCLASVLAAVAFGVKPLILQSGSMSPGIPTGSLALARSVPAGEVAVGDVVSVVASSGVRVTHRVVDVATSSSSSRRALTLQGDANDVPDAAPYVVDTVDRVLVDAPRLGYAIAWLSGPAGRFASGALLGVVVVLGWPRRSESFPAPRHLAPLPIRHARRRLVRTVVATALSVALVGGTDVATARPALAAFADSGTFTTGTFGAYTVPAVGSLGCVVTGNVLSGFTGRVSWTASTTPPHDVTYSATIVNNGATLGIGSTGGSNRYVEIKSGLLGSLLGSNIVIQIKAHAPGGGDWYSAPVQRTIFVALLGLSMNCVP